MTIAGDWYNELGSHMRLVASPSADISGTYTSVTGHASGQHPLVGRYDPPAKTGCGATVGWTVVWQNEQGDAACVTSWSGQYFEASERICASWLLTTSTSPNDMWEATTVGQDVFTRQAPARSQASQTGQSRAAPFRPRGSRAGGLMET
ncbi:avidin/streptavidin family protein [Kitasatospora sp. NPDC088346]|uniref:avidin/streptavidin family protein n=1 Tax=Kitasatospora sp. NPDC088346 TaxID=3364073 RepID=UPI00380AE0DD